MGTGVAEVLVALVLVVAATVEELAELTLLVLEALEVVGTTGEVLEALLLAWELELLVETLEAELEVEVVEAAVDVLEMDEVLEVDVVLLLQGVAGAATAPAARRAETARISLKRMFALLNLSVVNMKERCGSGNVCFLSKRSESNQKDNG